MTYQDTIIARGPVLYLPLNDQSNSYSDATGNGHGGAGDSNTSWQAVASFLTNDWAPRIGTITLANFATIPGPGGSFTYEVWVKMPTLATIPNFVAAPTIALNVRGPDTSSNDFYVWYGLVGAGNFDQRVGGMAVRKEIDGGNPGWDGISGASLDQYQCWHHLCFTWDGTTSHWYHDGRDVGTDWEPITGTIGNNPSYALHLNDAMTVTSASLAGGSPDASAAHLAIYNRALTALEVAENYAAAWPRQDGACFSGGVPPNGPIPYPNDIIRLRHGQTNDVCWETDSVTTAVKSGGSDVLALPFATLSAAPPTLLGKDPATSLPAYCPTPTAVEITIQNVNNNFSQPSHDQSTTCVQVRCGASQALLTIFLQEYGMVSQWLQQILTWLGTQAAVFVIEAVAGFIDAYTAGAGLGLTPEELALIEFVVQQLPGVTGQILAVFCASNLSPAAQNDIGTAAFCALQCQGNQISLDAAQMLAWQSRVAALPGSDFSGIQQDVCAAILLAVAKVPVLMGSWMNACQSGVQNPSHLCDLWTCS